MFKKNKKEVSKSTKKPFYKEKWFWIALVIFVILGNALGKDDDKETDSTPKVEATEKEEPKKEETKKEEKQKLTIALDSDQYSTDKDGKAIITGTTLPGADVTVGYGIVGDSVKAGEGGKFKLSHTIGDTENEEIEINANLDGESVTAKTTVVPSQEMIDQVAKNNDITILSTEPTEEQRLILNDLAKQKFEQDYPYKGSKLHSIVGVIQDWTQNGDAWFYKCDATIVNAFGTEQDAVVEFTITPTDASSGNVEMLAY